MKRSILGRVLVGAVLFLALGGPAPGAVGSCGGEVTAVDPIQFCVSWRTIECNRSRARGDVLPAPPTPCTDDPGTPENESDPTICNWLFCRSGVPSRCSSFAWPTDCNPPPNELVTNACLNAVSDISRLSTPNDGILECRLEMLCPRGAALTEALEETEPSAEPSDSEPPAPASGEMPQ